MIICSEDFPVLDIVNTMHGFIDFPLTTKTKTLLCFIIEVQVSRREFLGQTISFESSLGQTQVKSRVLEFFQDVYNISHGGIIWQNE